MGKREILRDKTQAGFTLVELAIVMIIIGLLIGGVLKGQELIANAAVTSTVSAVKGVDAATTTFRDTYAALPGDITNATARLPNCAAVPCNNAGNGDSRIGADGDIIIAPTNEMAGFWSQLSAADLLTGINPTIATPTTTWGGYYPSAPITGGFHAAFNNGALGTNAGARAGHYLVLHNRPGAAPGGTALTPLQAARIDRKMDDGSPGTGTVFPSVAACILGTVYNEASSTVTCDLFLRFQN